jgi:heme-degrading monooxygenase HmoA
MRLRIPWKQGPGRGPSAVVAMTCTNFERFRDMPGAALAALRLRRAFPSTQGAIGLSLALQPLARRSWSISAWETEEHLRRFLGSPAHVAIVRQYRSNVHVSSTISTVERFQLKTAWRDAERPEPSR